MIGRNWTDIAGAQLRMPERCWSLVQGVPGAGKTATCDEFISRRQNEEIAWTDKAGRKRRAAVFCVRVGPGALRRQPFHPCPFTWTAFCKMRWT